MEENSVKLIYKTQLSEYVDASLIYHRLFGVLKKKRFVLFSVFSLILSAGVIALAGYSEFSLAEERQIYFITGGIVAVITSVIITVLYKKSSEKNIRNMSATLFSTSPFIRELTQVEFFGEYLVITRDYMRIKVKYSALDYMISDGKYFIFGFGSDQLVRVITKKHQDPDMLFAADNLLREKLGNRFIYMVGGGKA